MFDAERRLLGGRLLLRKLLLRNSLDMSGQNLTVRRAQLDGRDAVRLPDELVVL